MVCFIFKEVIQLLLSITSREIGQALFALGRDKRCLFKLWSLRKVREENFKNFAVENVQIGN